MVDHSCCMVENSPPFKTFPVHVMVIQYRWFNVPFRPGHPMEGLHKKSNTFTMSVPIKNRLNSSVTQALAFRRRF